MENVSSSSGMTKSQPDLEPKEGLKDGGEKMEESTVLMESLSVLPGKGKEKEKEKEPFQAADLLSPHEPAEVVGQTSSANVVAPTDQILVVQDMFQQLMMVQKDLQKQMSSIVAATVEEGKRVESALGRNMEKSIKANVDAIWARNLELNAKREKAERDRVQQLTNLITNSFSKEVPAIFDRKLKKEITALGPVVARAVRPDVEKTIFSTIPELVQKGVGDKVMNQLDKSIGSKLEGYIEKHLQYQFQYISKKALKDDMRASLDTSRSKFIPAFERSCKVLVDQVDNTLHQGMAEHTSATQQQMEAENSPLAHTLRETISSASSITQNLTSLAMVAAGNPEVEAPIDPTKELSQLISERKYEEAFNTALQLTNVSIVSWLCSQVDLHALCTMVPVPLSQGVLLALLQQLACDIANDTAQKATWMTYVAITINPSDPLIAAYVRPIFDQVYMIVTNHQTTSASDAAKIKVFIHVINSVLVGFK